MARARIPSTAALRILRAEGVEHEILTYPYEDRGGAPAAAEALDLPLDHVLKTLVFEDADGRPFIMVQHGDRAVSSQALARALGTKSVRPCTPAVAERTTGYRVGGTSPFGTRRPVPVYVERSALELEWIVINGGARGVLLRMAPEPLVDLLHAQPVDAAQP